MWFVRSLCDINRPTSRTARASPKCWHQCHRECTSPRAGLGSEKPGWVFTTVQRHHRCGHCIHWRDFRRPYRHRRPAVGQQDGCDTVVSDPLWARLTVSRHVGETLRRSAASPQPRRETVYCNEVVIMLCGKRLTTNFNFGIFRIYAVFQKSPSKFFFWGEQEGRGMGDNRYYPTCWPEVMPVGPCDYIICIQVNPLQNSVAHLFYWVLSFIYQQCL